MSINLRPETCDDKNNPSFIGFRQSHLKGYAATKIDFSPRSENEKAGLLVFQNESHYYFMGKFLKNGKPAIELFKSGGIEGVPDSLLVSLYHFYYKVGNSGWIVLKHGLDAKFLSTHDASGFVGSMYAMYATSNGKFSNRRAYFDYFQNVNNDDAYRKQ